MKGLQRNDDPTRDLSWYQKECNNSCARYKFKMDEILSASKNFFLLLQIFIKPCNIPLKPVFNKTWLCNAMKLVGINY